MKQIIYGLNLAGYSTQKSSVAKIYYDLKKQSIDIVIFRNQNNPFCQKVDGMASLREVVLRESLFFKEAIDESDRLVVNCPVDLQRLGRTSIEDLDYVWMVSKRNIDYLIDSLPPLAGFQAGAVLRLKALLGKLGKLDMQKIFETKSSLIVKLNIADKSLWKYRQRESKGNINSILPFFNIFTDQSIASEEFDAILCCFSGLFTERGDTYESIRQYLERVKKYNERKEFFIDIPVNFLLASNLLSKLRPFKISLNIQN